MSLDPKASKNAASKLAYTEIVLPDQQCEMMLPAGTVVFCGEHFALKTDTEVIIQARDCTNYDNQRKARYSSDLEFVFRFYVKGSFGLPGRPSVQDQTIEEHLEDLGKIVRGDI